MFHVTIVRERADNHLLEHEFATLQQVGQRVAGTALASGVPAPLALFDLNGTAALTTSALRGKPMHDFVGEKLQVGDVAAARQAVTAAVNWIVELQKTLPTGRVLLPALAPAQILHDAATTLGNPEREWKDVERSFPPDLEEISITGVGSHGNFSLRNMVWDGRRVGVLGWLGFKATAPALYDLFTLAGSVDECAGGVAPVREIVDRAFEDLCLQHKLERVQAWETLMAAALQRLQEAAATRNELAGRQMIRVLKALVADSGSSAFPADATKCTAILARSGQASS